MKGDFARITFDASRHYSRVMRQQGRVDLEADWNEQSDIILHLIRALTKDIVGPYATPADAAGTGASTGFQIVPIPGHKDFDFGILHGHYYVDGILCENDGAEVIDGTAVGTSYRDQPDFGLAAMSDRDRSLKAGTYLAYLDVYERHVSSTEAEGLVDVALNGPDTASRSKVVWQVRVTAQVPGDGTLDDLNREGVEKLWLEWIKLWQPPDRGLLAASARRTEGDLNPCSTDPEARFRGRENQLIRVEVRQGGHATGKVSTGATFAWSRDNGSVVFPIRYTRDRTVGVGGLRRDCRFGLRAGEWVEVMDDDQALGGRPGLLLKIHGVDLDAGEVTLEAPASVKIPSYTETSANHPLLRRWESAERPIVEDGPLALEDGVEVQFFKAAGSAQHLYRTGDYWAIPARVATGNVEWPQATTGGTSKPVALPPFGVEHHFAPLAIVTFDGGGVTTNVADLRRWIAKGWS